MARNCIVVLALASAASSLAAAPLSVRVLDASGRPVTNAVVTLHPAASVARQKHAATRFVIAQQHLQFHPFLTIVPVGSTVSFPNLDPTKHHVYSFSPAKKFELKLFARDQSRAVQFERPGVVALGCNIHDQMSAFIVVTDSAWTAQTNAQGMVTFADAPNGPGRVTIWQPYLRAPGGEIEQAVSGTQRVLSVEVRLRAPPRAMPMADY